MTTSQVTWLVTADAPLVEVLGSPTIADAPPTSIQDRNASATLPSTPSLSPVGDGGGTDLRHDPELVRAAPPLNNPAVAETADLDSPDFDPLAGSWDALEVSLVGPGQGVREDAWSSSATTVAGSS
jgi:hypothetical protein